MCGMSQSLNTEIFGSVLGASYIPAYISLLKDSMPLVLWHYWLGVRKSIQPVKIEWWGVGVVICLEQAADCLHMVQLVPLHPKIPSSLASFKSRLVLPFWYTFTQVVLEKRPLNGSSGSSSNSKGLCKLVSYKKWYRCCCLLADEAMLQLCRISILHHRKLVELPV